MRSFRARAAWFGVYLLVNLAIITFSISLWFRGLSSEAIFVGLWAPTLNLLYLMFIATFDPFRRAESRGSRVVALQEKSRVA